MKKLFVVLFAVIVFAACTPEYEGVIEKETFTRVEAHLVKGDAVSIATSNATDLHHLINVTDLIVTGDTIIVYHRVYRRK